MSTKFGILKENVSHNKLVDENGELYGYISTDIFAPVFFRSMGKSRWLTEFGPYLDDDVKVYALDNTQQGVYTIKDCKELLKCEKQL